MALHVIGVRHHSPACARLVEATVRRLRPRFVLIEGPADMNDRLDELALAHHLPVALFTYRQDSNGSSRGSWSPFCAYSPEWVALATAREVGARALFADLPAWHDAFDGEGGENRYADRHDRHSHRLGELCARLGFEDVDSLWDHLFEQPAAEEEQARRLGEYFAALRADEPAGPRDAPREEFMARHAAWAMAEAAGGDVVFVCGGYHRPALERLWSTLPAERPAVSAPADARVGSYLVPFSFRRLSSFAGYASGMPSPAFYQAVWEEGPARAAEAMLFQAVRHLRAKRQRVSPADAIAASTLAAGLRALRGHAALARVDVLDGLAGALLKDALDAPLPWTRRGALPPRTDPILLELVAAFTGDRTGRLAPGTPRPPLLDDVARELARVGLSVGAQRVRAKLTEPAGAAASAVLHRLRLLAIPGVRLERGPRLGRGRTDLSEEWSVSHLPETDPALIEAALHGATLLGAAAARLEELARDAADVAALAHALEGAALAQIPELAERALAGILRVVGAEASLARLGFALERLLALRRGELVLGSRGQAEIYRVIEACFDRGLWLFEGEQGPTAPLDPRQVAAVRALRDAPQAEPALDLARARAVARRRTADEQAPPALRGAALGLVWSTRPDGEPEDASTSVRAMAHPRTFGDFLGGLFALAREEVVRRPDLLAVIDEAMTGFLRDDFMVALPSLRQAFAYFPPRERLAIAERVLALSGESAHGAAELVFAPVDADVVVAGARLDRAAAELAARFALTDGEGDDR